MASGGRSLFLKFKNAAASLAQGAPATGKAPGDDGVLTQTRLLMAARAHPLADMSDAELARFNTLLPWAAMTLDCRGRVVGQAHSAIKRAHVHPLLDRRQEAFDAALPLRGKQVLEIGCFEGIHTIGLLLKGAQVSAADGRIENVLKTQARLWAYGLQCPVLQWNVEQPPVAALPSGWDVLHHIGVLYHLADPVAHLALALPRTRLGVLLDTHVARDGEALLSYGVDGRLYRYRRKDEPRAATSPFAGMQDHAKYLLPDDLLAILERHGFADRRLVSDRNERNGRRVTLWAFREGVAAA